MGHKAEIDAKANLSVEIISSIDQKTMELIPDYSVVVIGLPRLDTPVKIKSPKDLTSSIVWKWTKAISMISRKLKAGANLLVYCETEVTPYIFSFLPKNVKYQTWIEVLTNSLHSFNDESLPNEHVGLFLCSAGDSVLKHNKLRIAYEYCPACGLTTKDYGGRKHLYDAYGTLMSDVWKDLRVDRADILPQSVLDRIRDMFTLAPKGKMLAIALRDISIDLPNLDSSIVFPPLKEAEIDDKEHVFEGIKSGDCLDLLSQVPSNYVTLAFADPPYNLAKDYSSYNDNVAIEDYLTWCDKWLEQYIRILKPGGTLVVINLPILSIRHFLYLERHAELSRLNWIVWDALSAPRRFIMPANYTLLVYRKNDYHNNQNAASRPLFNDDPILQPLADGYCLRTSCVKNRRHVTKSLSDVWTDIHRVKHNSKRLDHPCLLPYKLMARIISLYSSKGDVILDTFNGVGTTTLTAHILERRYIGFDKDSVYSEVTTERHKLIIQGKNPFEVGSGSNGRKNNGTVRKSKIKYEVPKKTIQLAIKNLGSKLNRIPTRQDVAQYLPEYLKFCDEYFDNWSEVTRACLTSGMSDKPKDMLIEVEKGQLSFNL